jgi:hypothetical protein
MDPAVWDTVGLWTAAVLTLVVFSYLLADNVLFRIAEHLFVGGAVGYAVVLAFHHVVEPRVLRPLGQGDLLALVPLGMGVLLLTKASKRLSWLGAWSVALMLGVGAALAVGGALLGTLIPQTVAAINVADSVGIVLGAVMVVGTTGVLLYFYANRHRDGLQARLRYPIVRWWGGIGRWFLVVTFGVILGVTVLTQLSLLIGRIHFLWADWLLSLGR